MLKIKIFQICLKINKNCQKFRKEVGLDGQIKECKKAERQKQKGKRKKNDKMERKKEIKKEKQIETTLAGWNEYQETWEKQIK